MSTHNICECFLPVIGLATSGPYFDSGAMQGYAQTRLYDIFSHTELLTCTLERERECVCACACVQLYGCCFFFSSAGLHAVYLCGCVLTYVSMYCMHGKASCVTEITPCFHAKVAPMATFYGSDG